MPPTYHKTEELADALQQAVILFRLLQPRSADRSTKQYLESLSQLENHLRGYYLDLNEN